MLQCRQGGEGDETAKGHWPAPEGELAGTACSICSHWPKRFGPALWTRCAAGPSGGGTTGRSFKILRSVWLSATPAAFSASASRRCWPSACSVRCCLARQNGGLFQKRPPAPLCDPCCQHRCVMEGAFLRQGAGQRLAGGAGVPARGLYGQQRGLLGADFHLPLAKQRVRYAAVAGGSGDHPPALV